MVLLLPRSIFMPLVCWPARFDLEFIYDYTYIGGTSQDQSRAEILPLGNLPMSSLSVQHLVGMIISQMRASSMLLLHALDEFAEGKARNAVAESQLREVQSELDRYRRLMQPTTLRRPIR
jgi:hypothetical protein